MTENHTHDWAPTDTGYDCTGCDETRPACNTCTRVLHTHNLACERCITHARRTLEDIREAAATPYAYQLGIKAIRYDKDRTTGGGEDILGTNPAKDDIELAQHIAAKTNTSVLSILRDPPNVIEPLLDWADNWAERRDETRPDNVFDYLSSRIIWAVNNPDKSAWYDYRTEASTIRARIRNLVGLSHRAESVPCVHCGGKIIQKNGTHGLEDHLECTGCGLIWGNREQLNWVNMTYYRDLPNTHPDALVTTEDARRILPDLKRNTLNQWISRGIIPNQGSNRRGQTLYRIGDIHDRHTGMERTA